MTGPEGKGCRAAPGRRMSRRSLKVRPDERRWESRSPWKHAMVASATAARQRCGHPARGRRRSSWRRRRCITVASVIGREGSRVAARRSPRLASRRPPRFKARVGSPALGLARSGGRRARRLTPRTPRRGPIGATAGRDRPGQVVIRRPPTPWHEALRRARRGARRVRSGARRFRAAPRCVPGSQTGGASGGAHPDLRRSKSCRLSGKGEEGMKGGRMDPVVRYLALGDSYTIGEKVAPEDRWPAQLAALLRQDGLAVADPVIIARPGWTTDDLLAGIERVASSGRFDLVSLLIGVNDQYRGGDVEEYRARFRALLERAVSFAGGDAGRVLVVSIPDWGTTPFARGRDRARIAFEI